MGLAISDIWKSKFSALDKFLFFTAILFALIFIVFSPRGPFTADWWVKAIPALFLGLLAVKHVPGRQGILLFLGLWFSAAGDIALSMGRRYFVIGLLLFAIAHVLYTLVFRADFVYRAFWTPVALALALYGLIMMIFLLLFSTRQREPLLLGLSVVYTVLIITMAIFAVYRRQRRRIVLHGALLFILSDSLIALNFFFDRDEWTVLLIAPAYYAAQFLIASGHVFDPEVGERE